MVKFKVLIFVIVCWAALFSLAGCQTPAGRSAGQVMDDATITTTVKAKIFQDSVLKGFAISVKTFKGEVTLTGAVNTGQEKERAETLAGSTQGVRKVNNLIQVK